MLLLCLKIFLPLLLISLHLFHHLLHPDSLSLVFAVDLSLDLVLKLLSGHVVVCRLQKLLNLGHRFPKFGERVVFDNLLALLDVKQKFFDLDFVG